MGRRRRNAYWSTAGDSGKAAVAHMSNPEEGTAGVSSASAQPPAANTRRSLRQQAKKAAVSMAEDDFEDIEDYEEEEEIARFTPLPVPPRKKRFLKESQQKSKMGKKKQDASETTAAILNRLISKTPSNKRGYVVKPGRPPNTSTSKASPVNTTTTGLLNHPKKRHAAAMMSTAARLPPQLTPAPSVSYTMSTTMPLKVEFQEGDGVIVPTGTGPKKRGRKRKVDLPVNLSMKTESGERIPVQSHPHHRQQQKQKTQDPEWEPEPNVANMQRKRGRQSAATANVKNRFPFCSLCLSKTPPNDYIINHMSCPNEYQKMRRLFSYIYKDLKFPFMPFDLERENVFDYCDLPLCDCCIQLYREIYDSYAQIEAVRDNLKSKIERMVYQIQLSEQNPAVAEQLSSIKNSPDSLMNKYCNFRRRFASYRPGDARGDIEGASLVPATIARIKVINQTPKRTAGTQTFLTAGQVVGPDPPTAPPPPPKTPQSTATATVDSANKATSGGATTTVKSNATTTTSAPVVIKKEVGAESVRSELTKAPSLKPQNSNTNGISSSTPRTSGNQNLPKVPKTTPPSQPRKIAPAPIKSTPPANPVRPAPHASVLTIVKSSGGGGPAIIRKLPAKPSILTQPARLLAIATPTHKTQISGNTTGAKPDVGRSTAKMPPTTATNKSASDVVVKDEPVDVEEILQPTEEEADPFFSGESPNKAAPSHVNSEEKNSDKDDSTTTEDDNSKSQSDTNVFHKHKKLRVLPVPSYCKESSNDSSDNNMTSKEVESKTNDDNETQTGKDNQDNDSSDTPEQVEQVEDDNDKPTDLSTGRKAVNEEMDNACADESSTSSEQEKK